MELGGAFVKNKTKKRRREDVVWRRLTASTHTHTHRWLMAVLLLLLLVLPCVVGSHFGDLYWPRSVCRYFFVDVDIHGALPRGCRFKRPRFFFSLTWIFFLSLSLSHCRSWIATNHKAIHHQRHSPDRREATVSSKKTTKKKETTKRAPIDWPIDWPFCGAERLTPGSG